jgi:cytoskeleton protein RodZ
MDDETFGSCLRNAREQRALTIGDVSASTKVPRSAIEMLESGALAGLPAHVFVRGFIRSYAKAVGISDVKPLGLFDRAVNAKSEAARAESTNPVVDPVLAGGVPEETDEATRRRGLGLAVFVIIFVLIATITLSLLLRRPPQSGEGLSMRPAASSPVVALGEEAGKPHRA